MSGEPSTESCKPSGCAKLGCVLTRIGRAAASLKLIELQELWVQGTEKISDLEMKLESTVRAEKERAALCGLVQALSLDLRLESERLGSTPGAEIVRRISNQLSVLLAEAGGRAIDFEALSDENERLRRELDAATRPHAKPPPKVVTRVCGLCVHPWSKHQAKARGGIYTCECGCSAAVCDFKDHEI
jgi:hypothetical protein